MSSVLLSLTSDCCMPLTASQKAQCQTRTLLIDLALAVAIVALATLHFNGTLSFLPPAACYIALGAGSGITLFALSSLVNRCRARITESDPNR